MLRGRGWEDFRGGPLDLRWVALSTPMSYSKHSPMVHKFGDIRFILQFSEIPPRTWTITN